MLERVWVMSLLAGSSCLKYLSRMMRRVSRDRADMGRTMHDIVVRTPQDHPVAAPAKAYVPDSSIQEEKMSFVQD
jgi:hypothetical protein